jgi:hypothetical protein
MLTNNYILPVYLKVKTKKKSSNVHKHSTVKYNISKKIKTLPYAFIY